MIKHYLKIAFRQLLKYKILGILYIVCLGIGVSTSILLYKYYSFESNYDAYLEHSDELYRVNMVSQNDAEQNTARTSPAVAKAMKDNFPTVKDFSRVVLFGDASIITESKSVKESDILLVEKRHFDVFSFQFKPGSQLEGFDVPGTVVMSDKLANKLYGDIDPVGQVVKINSPNLGGSVEFTVKGVYEDIRKDSHLKPELLMSFATVKQFLGDEIESNWHWNNLFTYIQVDEGTTINQLQDQFNHFVANIQNQDVDTYVFQPITEIHNDATVFSEFDEPVNGETLRHLLLLGILILMITYVNVINLYASISNKRMKEVGVRKASGAVRKQLFWQFLTESFLINAMGMLLAVTVIQTLTPYFESFFQIQGSIHLHSIADYWLEMVIILVIGTLLTGCYPALIMSGWKPQLVLKGTAHRSIGGVKFRSSILVLQFVVTIFLIAGSLVVYQQIDYILKYDNGLSTNHKIVIKQPNIDDSANTFSKLSSSLGNVPGIRGITATDAVPGMEVYWRTNQYSREKGQPSDYDFTYLNVEASYFDIFNIKTVAGGKLKPDQDNDGIILNETAVELLGFDNAKHAVGQTIYSNNLPILILGVVQDVHQQGLRNKINPTIYNQIQGDMNYYVLDMDQNITINHIEQLKKSWHASFPDSPFDYFYLNNFYNQQYRNDFRFQKFFSVFSILSILISSIGLIGLSLQALKQREKEVAIRKVLGASARHLFISLSKTYFILATLAYVIAIGLAHFTMQEWLANFTNQILLGPWFYIVPLVLAATLIFIIIFRQIIKATTKNPIDTIRLE